MGNAQIAVTSWTQIGDWYRLTQLQKKFYNIFYSIIAVLGAFIIGNIMMMVVLERRREIGLIKSMGMNRLEIMLLFLFEGIVLGFIGSVSGIIIGLIVNIILHFKGFDFSSLLGSFNFPMDN
ncbi:MAG: FtsX-like permease family protein, partial [bacterium]